MTKKGSDFQLWRALEEFDRDILDPVTTMNEVDALIRSAGGDPVSLGKRGAAFIADLERKRRLAWMSAAASKRDVLARRAQSTLDRSRMDRTALLAEFARLRNSPSMEEPIRAAFRGRRPEESDDDDLREILADLDRVQALSDEDDGEPKR